MKGNWGKILRVDLSKGTFEDVKLDEKLYRDYLGGSGLAAKLFFDMKGWKADPLGPENPLIFMLGPLSGLNYPGVSRMEICARSPLTGIWAESSVGGHIAPQLKGTGYDGLVIIGASDKPVYLLVEDQKMEIRDASHLWGKDTYETEELLKEEVGGKSAQVMSIGPAGENLVKYACIINDRGSAAGRAGLGAVMGSKKLKAVVVQGKKKVDLADEEAFKEARRKALEIIKFSVVAEAFGTFGSNVHMEYGVAMGDVPVKNWREAYWKGGPDTLAGTRVAETILVKHHSCYACPVHCKRIVKVDSGPYAMKEGPGSEYETAASLGTLVKIDSKEANHKANEICNRYGMDTISIGGTITYAIEAYEKGLLTDKDTGGVKLGWGQPDILVALITKIALRDGIGNDLAEGVKKMAEKYGGKEFAIHVKGLEVPMHDPRAVWGMGLSYATSVRGADHVGDTNLAVELGLINNNDLGVPRSWPLEVKGKAAQMIACQVKGSVMNSAVICNYVWSIVGGGLQEIAEVVNAATGFSYDVRELNETGERSWYLKRAIGNLCGLTRADDIVPRRLLEPHLEGVTSNISTLVTPIYLLTVALGKLRNKRINDTIKKVNMKFLFPVFNKVMRAFRFLPGFRGHERRLKAGNLDEIKRTTVPIEQMLADYYEQRNIDEQGRPTRARLESLGLKDVADAFLS